MLTDNKCITEIQGVYQMDIKGSDIQSKLNVYQISKMQRKSTHPTATEKSAASTPQQDRVALSNRGQLIADAQRAMAFVPDIRELLVSRIQYDLQNGTHVIDNQKTAEGILRESMVNQAAMM
jgi:anti-sigma28 factor (negative regulator of flagellin synthesis)